MPRGRGKSHKGKARHFTSGEELERQSKDLNAWRAKREESDEEKDEDEEDIENPDIKKGVSSLIQVENPNHMVQKSIKAGDLDVETAKPELSRREREAIEKEQARQRYEKLHAEGKTDQARADLARLSIIKKQREEAAKKKDEEKKSKDAAAQAAADASRSAQSQALPAGSLKAARKKRK